MELAHSRMLDAPINVVWDALNDPATLMACIPGCETFERSGDNEYRTTMTSRIGPVSAKFSGRVTLLDVTPPTGYTLKFEGQGGAAGFANGEARVVLAESHAGRTTLSYVVKAQIGGKLAQIGSRLVDGAAAKLAGDFFARFAARVAPATVQPGDDAAVVAGVGTPASVAALRRRDGTRTWTRFIAIAAILGLLAWLFAHRGQF